MGHFKPPQAGPFRRSGAERYAPRVPVLVFEEERLRWASRSRRGAAGPQITHSGTRKGALSARRDAPLSRSFSRMRTSLLSRSSPTPQGVHAHGRTPALFAPSSPQQHQHPGLAHHRQPIPRQVSCGPRPPVWAAFCCPGDEWEFDLNSRLM